MARSLRKGAQYSEAKGRVNTRKNTALEQPNLTTPALQQKQGKGAGVTASVAIARQPKTVTPAPS
jgi:hypothetical protein